MSRRKRGSEEGSKGAPEWMTTYSDLVTLLLCFFVLLFAMSTVDVGKFKQIMASFQGSTGILDGGRNLELEMQMGELLNGTEDGIGDEEFKDLISQLEIFLEAQELTEVVQLISEERGLVIRFMDKVLFESGKAVIRSDAENILQVVAKELNKEQFHMRLIKIEGHADTEPINTLEFPTNWELSSARATNVLRFFIEKANINPDRISSSAYSFYRPVAPNDTVENKSKNRRADIVILRERFESWEP